jgi:hypothetical protein
VEKLNTVSGRDMIHAVQMYFNLNSTNTPTGISAVARDKVFEGLSDNKVAIIKDIFAYVLVDLFNMSAKSSEFYKYLMADKSSDKYLKVFNKFTGEENEGMWTIWILLESEAFRRYVMSKIGHNLTTAQKKKIIDAGNSGFPSIMHNKTKQGLNIFVNQLIGSADPTAEITIVGERK